MDGSILGIYALIILLESLDLFSLLPLGNTSNFGFRRLFLEHYLPFQYHWNESKKDSTNHCQCALIHIRLVLKEFQSQI